MKVLVIPDVHLKPWMFDRAAKLMKRGAAEKAVCLMDIADDWQQQYNLDLYMNTYDAAIQFAKDHSETLWCYGNHDVCYPWNQRESGYSPIAPSVVCEKLRVLRESLPDEKQLAFVHRIDKVLFLHGGLGERFVQKYVPEEDWTDIDRTLEAINSFGYTELWQGTSPIWLRPQYSVEPLYRGDEFLQVVGHTPMRSITKRDNTISCDVFSTDSSRKPYGTQEFLLIDTDTWEYRGIK